MCEPPLNGKKVLVGVSASVAIVESFYFIRELRRLGAETKVVMSADARKMISEKMLHFASGNEVITEMTGKAEHIVDVENSDIYIIYPASADIIGKMSSGLGNDPVSLCAIDAIGAGVGVWMAPSMNLNMYRNPIVLENIEKLRNAGVKILEPVLAEGKAKVVKSKVAAAMLSNSLSDVLRGLKVSVIGGAGAAPIDEFRIITNLSTGRTAVEIARQSYLYGARVVLYLGLSATEPPEWVENHRFTTMDDLLGYIERIKDSDAVLVPAALPDFVMEKYEGKISSRSTPELKLAPAPKFLKNLREQYEGYLVAFKLETSEESAIKKAGEILRENNLDMVVGNKISDTGESVRRYYLVKGNSVERFRGTRGDLAKKLIFEIAGLSIR